MKLVAVVMNDVEGLVNVSFPFYKQRYTTPKPSQIKLSISTYTSIYLSAIYRLLRLEAFGSIKPVAPKD